MVAEKGIVSIAELTERMHVSHMTIRRDFTKTGAARRGNPCLWRRAIIDLARRRTPHQIKPIRRRRRSGDWQPASPGTARKLYLPDTTIAGDAVQLVTMNKLYGGDE